MNHEGTRARPLPSNLELNITVRDPEVVAELLKCEDEESRERYALAALRLGVLSMRMAGGQVDAAAVRDSGKEIVNKVGEVLSRRVLEIENELNRYFDPRSGHLHQRVEALVSKDGELERLLRAHLGSDDSTIAKSLARHLGENSPVFKMLSPTDSTGIKTQIEEVVTGALQEQREKLIGQFSLDNKDSALSRLRREIQEIMEKKSSNDAAFHQEVRSTLAEYRIRKDEAAKSTRHGVDFEEQLGSVIAGEAARLGDVFEATGDTIGQIKGNRKGDHVTTMGPDSAAPGVRIAWEAKQDQKYHMKMALDEIAEVRKNRGARVGVFVFSSKVAKDNIEPFARYGNDLMLIWDAEDEATDIRVRAAYSVARAMVSEEHRESAGDDEMVGDIDRAVRAVEEQIKHLDTLDGLGQDIIGKSEKIIERAGKMKRELVRQVRRLDEQVDSLKGS